MVYSLQDKKNHPVGPVVAGAGPLSFDVPVRVAPGPRSLGDFVRSEGPTRRFVYIAIGGQAGAAETPWSRRAKIDIHTLPIELLEQALAGGVLAADLPEGTRTAVPPARPCARSAPGGSPGDQLPARLNPIASPAASRQARPMPHRPPFSPERPALIGLIGGMSWESSAQYYRLINEGVRDRLGGRPLRGR